MRLRLALRCCECGEAAVFVPVTNDPAPGEAVRVEIDPKKLLLSGFVLSYSNFRGSESDVPDVLAALCDACTKRVYGPRPPPFRRSAPSKEKPS